MDSNCKRRVSNSSDIYEEILFDTAVQLQRRQSRVSIASGIYEEMKLTTSSTDTTTKAIADQAPPLPPFPPQRKRINTYETEKVGVLRGELPRCNTIPETDALKTKKYKTMFEQIFRGARTKRAESVSETQACFIDDLLNCRTPEKRADNEKAFRKQQKGHRQNIAKSKRNSFSSPDLSKINFLQFDEEAISDNILINSFSHELNVSGSVESLNISEQIPSNFNFSACNTSKINLIGSHVAADVSNSIKTNKKVLIEDSAGYCIMAPIVKKAAAPSTESTSSGYSTSSHCSSSSSRINSNEEQLNQLLTTTPTTIKSHNLNTSSTIIAEESGLYMQMYGTLPITDTIQYNERHPLTSNMYENLLNLKTTQEFEILPAAGQTVINTSTPTESTSTLQHTPNRRQEEENFYQTPRKSIISVDEKIPSYYPNISDHVKSPRNSRNTCKEQTPTPKSNKILKTKITPEQQYSKQKTTSPATKKGGLTLKVKKTAAQKISDNVYAVTHNNNNNNDNSNSNTAIGSAENDVDGKVRELLPEELLQLSVLQKIDFKFDDIKSLVGGSQTGEENTDALSRTPSTAPCTVSATPVGLSTPLSSGELTPGQDSEPPLLQLSGGMRKFASLPRFKKIDFSPLKLKIHNVLQRHQT